MRLVYKETQQEVKIGDKVPDGDQTLEVLSFSKPHKPESSGKVSVAIHCGLQKPITAEYYVGVIGAEWIEREDRDE